MATVKESYTSPSAFTITLNGLASAAARQSTAVSNATTLFMDAFVSLTVATASGTIGTNPICSIYVYTLDGDGNYTDGATGSDAAFTMQTIPNLVLAKQFSVNTAATTAYSGEFSIAQLFGGNLPNTWGIIVQNNTGLALASSGCTAYYRGINQTVI